MLIHCDEDLDWEGGVLAVAISSSGRLICFASCFGRHWENQKNSDVPTTSRQKLDQKLLFGLNCAFPLFIYLFLTEVC